MSRCGRLADSAFLVSLVVFSAALYVAGLGFASDDWNFLGDLVTAPDQSLGGLLRRQWDHGVMLRVRPPQMLYQAALYAAFGLDPLGYHVVNVAVLCAIAVLLHWVLVELRVARLLAVAVPAVYLLLPHYATNRFWFASAGYGLTIALALLSVGADLRAARSVVAPGRRAWKLLSLVALAVAALGYEIVFPLLAAAPVLVWWTTHAPGDGPRTARGLIRHVAPHALVLAAAAAFKVAVGGEDLLNASYARHLGRLAMVVVGPNFGTYGVGLPAAAWWAARHATWPVLIASVVLAAGVFAYLAALGRATGAGGRPPPLPTGWGRMAVAGLAVVALGYAAFLVTNGHVFFTSSGFGNRTAMAAALGVAVVLVAAIGWLSERLAARVAQRAVFAGSSALLCQAGFLVTNALALDHVAARRTQEAVLRDIRAIVPVLAPGSALILRGACPYIGSAIVFERDDLEGALRATYREDALKADVGSILVVGKRGLQTAATGYSPITYPYGPRLLLVDLDRRTATPVPSAERAAEHLGSRRLEWPDRCPAGSPELSVPVFYLDRLALPFHYTTFP